MPGPTGRLRRSDRLLKSAEFERVGRGGRRVADPAFVLLVARREAGRQPGGRRLGITVSRKVGGAVVRNRVKRCIREWFRRSREELEPGIDLVVIGRAAAAGLSCAEIEGILCKMAHRAGVERV